MDQEEHWKDIEKGKEEDYFLRKHREWLEKKRGSKGDKGVGQGAEPVRCPRCSDPLEEISQRQVVVLKCPGCGGGWLDREALKTIMAG